MYISLGFHFLKAVVEHRTFEIMEL